MGEPAPLTRDEIAYWTLYAQNVVEAVNKDEEMPRAAYVEDGTLVPLNETIFKLSQLALLSR